MRRVTRADMAKQFHCACGRVVFEGSDEPMAPIACYCDDCQAVAKQIDALPAGKSGIGPDGGTVSTLYRKDLVRCVSGQELLVKHKLRPGSPATRMLASCCNSNMTTVFENWLPIVAVRTHSVNVDSVTPAFCINTKYAPDKTKIIHAAQRASKIPFPIELKVAKAAVVLALGGGQL